MAPGNQPGFDVYKSELFPGETFQVKYSRPVLRGGGTKKIGSRRVTIKDTWRWTFRVSKMEYKADWYVLFGERDGMIYPFLLNHTRWVRLSSGFKKSQMLSITAQEYSKCGRYPSSQKRNRHWEYYVGQEWPGLFLAKLMGPKREQAKMTFEQEGYNE